MCSSRWDTPILGRGSWALALRTQIPVAAERTLGTRSDSTITPLGAVVWWISRSSRTVSITASGRGPPPASRAALCGTAACGRARRPPAASPAPGRPSSRRPRCARCGRAAARRCGAALHAGEDLDEGAERGGALHHALVHLADLGHLHHAGDDVARPLPALAHGGDGHEPVVVDIDLGAGLLLNGANRLPLRADDVADLLRGDLDRDDARCVLGQLRARRGDGPVHDVEDVH